MDDTINTTNKSLSPRRVDTVVITVQSSTTLTSNLYSYTGYEAQILADVPRVNPADHLPTGVPELVPDLIGSLAGRDASAGVGMAQTVASDAALGAVVEAGANGSAAQMPAEVMARPGRAVAINENPLALAQPPQSTQQAHGEPIQANQSRFAGLVDGLVLREMKVWKLAVNSHGFPFQIAHLLCPAASQVEEQQGKLQGAGADTHQGAELGIRRRSSSLRNEASQGSGTAVRAGCDKLLISRPAEAGKDRSNHPALRVRAFPIGVIGKKLRQVVLAKLLYLCVAEFGAEGVKVALIAFRNIFREAAGSEPAGYRSQIDTDDFVGSHGDGPF